MSPVPSGSPGNGWGRWVASWCDLFHDESENVEAQTIGIVLHHIAFCGPAGLGVGGWPQEVKGQRTTVMALSLFRCFGHLQATLFLETATGLKESLTTGPLFAP